LGWREARTIPTLPHVNVGATVGVMNSSFHLIPEPTSLFGSIYNARTVLEDADHAEPYCDPATVLAVLTDLVDSLDDLAETFTIGRAIHAADAIVASEKSA